VTYEFKVESRNGYGYSDFSQTIALLAAFTPDAPIDAETIMDVNRVFVQWS
jgi:hypothetical protein